MDPLTAIGLAGNIAQFIDFAAKLFRATHQIHFSASGLKSDIGSVETLTHDLLTLSHSIRDSMPVNTSMPSNVPTKLLRLATDCQKTADELLAVLTKLKPTKTQAPWQSFKAALKTIWKQQKIDAMSSRLDSYRLQLALELQYLQGFSIEQLLGRLWDENVQIKADLGWNIRELKAEIAALLGQMISELKKRTTRANIPSQMPRQRSNLIACTEKASEINERGRVIFRKMEVLKSLYFTGMGGRYSKIGMAHQETYQWVYNSKFRDWMVTDTPIFWISGKPGSGKSTLMKYLVENPITYVHLEKWAEPCKLNLLSYFFWVNDNNLQRSQEGLLRSIIFDLLRQNHHLINDSTPPTPSIYEPTSNPSEQIHSNPKYEWTFDALIQTFRRIIAQLAATDKYCIFIDGLDEYDGDHASLIECLKSLQSFGNLKLCVASRPWNIFESTFGCDQSKKIYMQDLTKGDIERYVKDKLETQAEYQRLISDSEASNAQEIVEELVDKAQGVFLWVNLVVKSLIEGLQNMDRIIDLKRRLRAFPSDLNEYFRYILNSLDPIYRVQTAKGFQAALSAQHPLSVMHFWYIDLEEEEPEYAMKMKTLDYRNLDSFRRQEYTRVENMTKRINARFRGLLEVTEEQRGTIHLEILHGGEHTTPVEKVVDFLHRTVRDFLLTRDCQDIVFISLPDTFDVNLSLCRAYLADLKTSFGREECFSNKEPVEIILTSLFYYADHSRSRTSRSVLSKILREVDRIVNSPSDDVLWINASGLSKNYLWCVLDTKSFMHYAIEHGAKLFVTTVLPSKYLTYREKSEYLRAGFLDSTDPTIVSDLVPIGPHASMQLHNCPVIPIVTVPASFSDYDEMVMLVKELCKCGVLTQRDLDAIQAWFTVEEQAELEETLSNYAAKNDEKDGSPKKSKYRPKRRRREAKEDLKL